jgi:hypothetical protein
MGCLRKGTGAFHMFKTPAFDAVGIGVMGFGVLLAAALTYFF